jgi:hypothetical protein
MIGGGEGGGGEAKIDATAPPLPGLGVLQVSLRALRV